MVHHLWFFLRSQLIMIMSASLALFCFMKAVSRVFHIVCKNSSLQSFILLCLQNYFRALTQSIVPPLENYKWKDFGLPCVREWQCQAPNLMQAVRYRKWSSVKSRITCHFGLTENQTCHHGLNHLKQFYHTSQEYSSWGNHSLHQQMGSLLDEEQSHCSYIE